jgi:hypothetical protein
MLSQEKSGNPASNFIRGFLCGLSSPLSSCQHEAKFHQKSFHCFQEHAPVSNLRFFRGFFLLRDLIAFGFSTFREKEDCHRCRVQTTRKRVLENASRVTRLGEFLPEG